MTLGRGERAPDFVLSTSEGMPTRFYGHAGGRPTLLIFADEHILDHLYKRSEAAFDFELFAVVPDAPRKGVPFPVFIDRNGKVRTAYKVADQDTTAYVLDPNLRVLRTFELKNEADAVQLTCAVLEEQGADSRIREVTSVAPVLMVPKVMEGEISDHLIDLWEKGDAESTGVEQSSKGKREEQLDAELKRRRDLTVTDQGLVKVLSSTIGRRVIPELRKAFAYQATCFEGFKVVCYEAEDAGFFRAHRDNLSPTTAHRRFAMSLNLNEDYKGGQLRFPEYGLDLYRPEAGAALMFSCSNLHEVVPVTRGRRFALLSFLFGEEGRRQAS